MAISLVHADSRTQFAASSTSQSVTIDAGVQAGDLIVIPYMTRSAVTTPAGFAKVAESAYSDVTVAFLGAFVKSAVGDEGGTSVTVTQASSGRIEIMHAIHRSTTGSLTASKNNTFIGNDLASGQLALAETAAFLSLSVYVNTYSPGSEQSKWGAFGEASDVGWQMLNGQELSTSVLDRNRLQLAANIYTEAATSTIEWISNASSGGDLDWGFNMITLVEGAATPVPVSFTGTVPTLTGNEGSAFSEDLSGYFSGSETPFSYSVQAGALPAGLTLNTSTGVISGTPTAAGIASGVVIRATDSATDTADTNTFSIDIAAAAAVRLQVDQLLYTDKAKTALVSDTAYKAFVLNLTNNTLSKYFASVDISNGVVQITDPLYETVGNTFDVVLVKGNIRGVFPATVINS